MLSLSFKDFESASIAALKVLRRRLGFDLWMVTRTEGDHWIVLQSEDHGYGVEPGMVFRWADSFCSEMVKGNGPNIAPQSDAVPAYAAAPIGSQVPIKAYIGLPLVRADGNLFGTLCAIHPHPQPESIKEDEDLVELLGGLLSTVLRAELKAAGEARRSERLEAETLSDSLTGLYNRRGWDRLLDAEEERCRRFGHPAALLVIDLDEMKKVNDTLGHAEGDALLIRTANCLRNVARSADIVARLGGDEFGILCTECPQVGAETFLARLRQALSNAQIKASIGLAMREPGKGLSAAWCEADKKMYQEKHSR